MFNEGNTYDVYTNTCMLHYGKENKCKNPKRKNLKILKG